MAPWPMNIPHRPAVHSHLGLVPKEIDDFGRWPHKPHRGAIPPKAPRISQSPIALERQLEPEAICEAKVLHFMTLFAYLSNFGCAQKPSWTGFSCRGASLPSPRKGRRMPRSQKESRNLPRYRQVLPSCMWHSQISTDCGPRFSAS